jgi:hypothetical protein
MNQKDTFQIVFPKWYDERGEWEAKEKGWLDGVEIHLANGATQPLFFYDPVRLAQDLEAETKQGRPVISQPGMIVIPEVTRDAILVAVDKLVDEEILPFMR